MASETAMGSEANATLRVTQVCGLALVCLILGVAIGYVSRELQSTVAPTQTVARTVSPHAVGAMSMGHMPSLEEMKHMADKQAEPLLEKLKSDPKNSALLMQVGAIYHTTHQFKEAATYYHQAVASDPKNVLARTKLAASLYRAGDVDGAIAQLNEALEIDPKDANALFNLGMIRLQGKRDAKGALAAWKTLLKTNPQLSADRKAEVQKLMAEVLTMMGDQHGMREVTRHE